MRILFLTLCFVLLSMTAEAVTVCYQPTPFPDWRLPAEDSTNKGTHIWDRYVGGKHVLPHQGTQLKVGCTTGERRCFQTFIKLDLKGLPQKVSRATFHLSHISSNLSQSMIVARRVTAPRWRMSRYTPSQRLSTDGGENISMEDGTDEYVLEMTEMYNKRKEGGIPHFGIKLDLSHLLGIGDHVIFHSSSSVERKRRPKLCLTFEPPIPIPDFKMPLPEDVSWLVTTEIGGFDCKGEYKRSHDKNNYYAIDFSSRHKGADGKPVYKTMDGIPILASAGGVVAIAHRNPNHANGYYVVIDHDGDGDIRTGFSTWYLHFKNPPLVTLGEEVRQGKTLGHMGNTGLSTGTHLHFGIRYEDVGYEDTPYLDYVLMESAFLKEFQSECKGDTFIGYSPFSSNIPIE